ncbi:MAG: hypothetical protein N3F03_04625 [Ignavibacteria bacterium]|nr:hypothetical protein [Ignavibacteria bacterium]
MSNPVYYFVSFIIGISVILILIRLTTFATDENIKAMSEEKLISNFVTTQEIVEYYLKKIGYKASNFPIIDADTTNVKFICDDNDDGIIDTLEIRLGDPALKTKNPNDYQLLLIRNGVKEIIAPDGVTKFNLEFFDVNGSPTKEKMFIKSIRVILKIESDEQFDGYYQFFEDEFFIKPRNLV